MEESKKARGRKTLWTLIIIAAVLIALAAAFLIYTGDYYRAQDYESSQTVQITECDGYTIYGDSAAKTGIIFYPGAKVDSAAYAPILSLLAAKGYCAVAAEMPFHLAIFGENAADGIIEALPDIEAWYMAGHSMGGVFAAKYAAAHTDEISGLILLASYPSEALPDSLQILSIYGSKDGVFSARKYESAKQYMPQAQEIILEGGNHAQFGCYGEQKGDGAATISPEQQWNQTADAIEGFING